MAEDIFQNKKIVGFDLETTGISIRHSKVIQYAIIGSDSNENEIKIDSLVNPLIPIPKNSTMIHGIEDLDVINLPSFKSHVETVKTVLNDSIVVGHNIKKFDWPILENEFLRCGKKVPKPYAIIDTLEIARKLKLARPHKLGILCERYGISLTNAHDALSDASATLLLLWKLMEENPKLFRNSIKELQISNSKSLELPEQELGPGIDDLPILDSNGRLRRSGNDIVLAFGRHKGKTIQEIKSVDEKYLHWIINSDKQMNENIITEIKMILDINDSSVS